jgi:hypothetical protein
MAVLSRIGAALTKVITSRHRTSAGLKQIFSYGNMQEIFAALNDARANSYKLKLARSKRTANSWVPLHQWPLKKCRP